MSLGYNSGTLINQDIMPSRHMINFIGLGKAWREMWIIFKLILGNMDEANYKSVKI